LKLRRWGRAWCLLNVAGVLSACAHGGRTATPPTPVVEVPRSPQDPVARLIAEAEARVQAGHAQARDGHLAAARVEFDKAIDLYLGAPGGAYGDPRVAEAYRAAVETIHVHEMEALAAGDGFTETKSEPASIDEVAALPIDEAPASEETRAKVAEEVEQETIDFPIDLNEAVLSCIDLYQGRLRDWFEAALNRGQRYLPHIRKVFAEEGIPLDLAYVALVESAFKPAAYSRAKAKGVWQFIAATGKRYGLQQDWWVDERSNPEKATRAAAAYLKELYRMFGDWNLALAAYNAGEGKIQRGLAKYRVESFWQLRQTRHLRRETRNYVPLIQAAVLVAKAPEKYGFTLSPEAAPEHETFPVKGAVDLRVIAECVETAVEDIQQMNPELRRLATPANRTFEVRVPAGRGSTLGTCLEALPPEKRVRFRTHVVGRGQTLARIAAANGVRARDIAEANGFTLKQRLPVGTELIIPIAPRAQTASVRQASGRAKPRVPPVRGSELGDGRVRIRYMIKPGDTLAAIAAQYGTTVRELQSWNGLRSSRIGAGDTLTIYAETAKN
jgi:membrane-bound lytic murein transglycosylase D